MYRYFSGFQYWYFSIRIGTETWVKILGINKPASQLFFSDKPCDSTGFYAENLR